MLFLTDYKSGWCRLWDTFLYRRLSLHVYTGFLKRIQKHHLYTKTHHRPIQHFHPKNAFFGPLLYHRFCYSVIRPQRHAEIAKEGLGKKGVGEVERRYWPAIGCPLIAALLGGGGGKENSFVNWILKCRQMRLACRKAVREWMAAVAVPIERAVRQKE